MCLFLSSLLPGGPSTVVRKMRPPRLRGARGQKNYRVRYLFVIPSCTCFLCFFFKQFIAGRLFYSKENASTQNFRCKSTINMPRTVPLCFSLLYMFFVSFLEQCFAGRRFYSKENASAQTFAVQEDDKLAA